jgi:hypothetical protein
MREATDSGDSRRSGRRRVLRALWAGVFACVSAASFAQPGSTTDQFNITEDYVEQFYPLWFTYYQSEYSASDRLVGPVRISPLYQIVVAINDDTLYASTFLDLSSQPVVLTVPSTKVRYSILTLDPYGDVLDSGIPNGTSGVYALTGPGYTGSLPAGVTPIPLPLNHLAIIFRADKYSSTGKNQTAQAELFRKSLLMQTLSDWQSDPSGGAAAILPELLFAAPFKLAADTEIAKQPIAFLQQLQAAVASPNTPPLSTKQQALSKRFNALFAEAGSNTQEFAAGAQAAHMAILQQYLTHTDKNNWINFTNIGTWGQSHNDALDRSAITEFIQFGNNFQAAAYYQAFSDVAGNALNGAGSQSYVLHIPKNKIPQAERFWSFTAYTPETIELVRNAAHKYEVASYTPGLHYNSDGSISITMATTLPPGVPEANWLPIPAGPFNIMLRVYGPEGNVADGPYAPPGIVKQ